MLMVVVLVVLIMMIKRFIYTYNARVHIYHKSHIYIFRPA